MIKIDKLRSIYLITRTENGTIKLQTQRSDYKTAKAYAKALGKKHKSKVKDNVKTENRSL